MSPQVRVITLQIDGKEVSARGDSTILQVARENNMFIPTLCYLNGLSLSGACRLCLVEVKGSPKLQPACVTRVEENMEVSLNSERLAKYRRMILELLFSERNHICSVCVSNGRCELQAMAQSLGVTHVRYPYNYPSLPVDMSHERFVLDHNRCILCTRCVRVCAEVEGAHVWDITSRGIQARLVSDLNQPWGEARSCTSSASACKRAPPERSPRRDGR